MIVVNLLLLIIGFVLLVKGADYFVEGSSSVAGLLGIPSVVIGLTIVAMGTSAPEAAVSLTASLSGNSDISLGNIIGSNIFNLLVVVGVCAAIKPFVPEKDIMKRDFFWNIGITVLLILFILDKNLQRYNGLVLLLLMITYLVWIVRSALKNREEKAEEKTLSPLKSALYILFGLAAVIIGGKVVVANASAIAKTMGMSETLIGLTIVAIGTSLPELVTSFVAAKKGDSGLALGNVVGSNLFNIMFILGASSLISPMAAASELVVDSVILLGVSLLMYVFCKTSNKINRAEGIACIAAYAAYSVFIILR